MTEVTSASQRSAKARSGRGEAGGRVPTQAAERDVTLFHWLPSSQRIREATFLEPGRATSTPGGTPVSFARHPRFGGEWHTRGFVNVCSFSPGWIGAALALGEGIDPTAEALADLLRDILFRGTPGPVEVARDGSSMLLEHLRRRPGSNKWTRIAEQVVPVITGSSSEFAGVIPSGEHMERVWTVDRPDVIRASWRPRTQDCRGRRLSVHVGVSSQVTTREVAGLVALEMRRYADSRMKEPVLGLAVEAKWLTRELLYVEGWSSPTQPMQVVVPPDSDLSLAAARDRVFAATAEILPAKGDAVDLRPIAWEAIRRGRSAGLEAQSGGLGIDTIPSKPTPESDVVLAMLLAEHLVENCRHEEGREGLLASALRVLCERGRELISCSDQLEDEQIASTAALLHRVVALMNLWSHPTKAVQFHVPSSDATPVALAWHPELLGQYEYVERVARIIESAPFARWLVARPFPVAVTMTAGQLVESLEVVCPCDVPIYHSLNRRLRRPAPSTAWSWAMESLSVVGDVGSSVSPPPEIQECMVSLRETSATGDARARRIAGGMDSTFGALLAQRVPAEQIATMNDLLIVCDRQPSRTSLLLVNLNPDACLNVTVDGVPVPRLAPRSVQPDSFGDAEFSDSLIRLEGDCPTVGIFDSHTAAVVELPDRIESRSLPRTWGAGLDPNLFVGRAEELARIAEHCTGPNLRIREPVAVQGNRRSGKTTLAEQAFVAAQAAGHLSFYAKVDNSTLRDLSGKEPTHAEVVEGVVGGLSNALRSAHRSRNRTLLAAGMQHLPELPDLAALKTPVDVFQAISEWVEDFEVLPVGILLDEYDTWLYGGDLPPAIRAWTSSVGSTQWSGVAVIGTIQRHVSSGAVKDWFPMRVGVLLDPSDMRDFFCPHLNLLEAPERDASGVRVLRAERYLTTGQVLDEVILESTSTRPYFWGQVLGQVTPQPQSGGSFLLDHDSILDAVRTFEATDNYLQTLIQEPDVGTAPQAVVDAFTDEERIAISLWLDREIESAGQFIDGHHANRVSSQGFTELIAREIVLDKGKRLSLAGNVWHRLVSRSRRELIAFRDVADRRSRALDD